MKLLTLCLYGIGAYLVWNSERIGISFVTVYDSPGNYHWNNDQAFRMAETVRLLGAMIFGAGLVERLVLAKQKQAAP